MWGKGRGRKAGGNVKIDTLIGVHTRIEGNMEFSGGLHVEGTIHGDVHAEPGSDSVLTLCEDGRIEGDVDVPRVVINGTVIGDVHAGDRIELAARARIQGNVYYNLIEMAMGAEVNGNLVHQDLAPARDEGGDEGIRVISNS